MRGHLQVHVRLVSNYDNWSRALQNSIMVQIVFHREKPFDQCYTLPLYPGAYSRAET